MNVTLLDHMGSDLSIVNSARVSFNKESKWNCCSAYQDGGLCECPDRQLCERDTKLINYLAKHNHWTPFGHCFASFRIKAPIFVARQLGKHQVGLVWNEVSRRYVDDEPEFYTPRNWRKKAENVKQGSSNEVAFTDLPLYDELIDRVYEVYDYMIENGVCPEQARMCLPQSMLTTFIWSGSLAAFARVCKLRLDPHTQQETREVAQMINDEMKELFPVSWEALSNK